MRGKDASPKAWLAVQRRKKEDWRRAGQAQPMLGWECDMQKKPAAEKGEWKMATQQSTEVGAPEGLKELTSTNFLEYICSLNPVPMSSQPTPEATSLICDGCGQPLPAESPQACSACCSAFYCGRECQRAGWKAGHKSKCAELAAARALESSPAAPPPPTSGGGPARLTGPAFLSHVQALLSSDAQASQAAGLALVSSVQLRLPLPLGTFSGRTDFSRAHQGALHYLQLHKDRALAVLSSPALPAPLRALAVLSLQPQVEIAARLASLTGSPLQPHLAEAGVQAAELLGDTAAWADPALAPLAAALAAARGEPPERAPAALALLHAHALSCTGELLFAATVSAIKRNDAAECARQRQAVKPFLLGLTAAVAASTEAAPLVTGPVTAALCLNLGGIERCGLAVHSGAAGAALALYLRLLANGTEALPAGPNPESEFLQHLQQLAGCIKQGQPPLLQGLRSAGGGAALSAAAAALPRKFAAALAGVKI